MAEQMDRAALLAEAYKRGILPPQQKAAYEEAMRRGLVKAPADALTTEAPEGPGIGERFLRGVKDPVDAAAQMLVHALPEGVVEGVNKGVSALNEAIPATRGMGLTPASAKEFDAGLAASEKEFQGRRQAAGQDGIDWARFSGAVIPAVAVAAATKTPATFTGAAKAAGLTGAVGGALQPVAEPTDSFWTDKAVQAGTGAATGAVAGPAFMAASRVIQPQASKAVQTLLSKKVIPTPGQVMGGVFARTEEKLASVPLLGDAIKAGQRRAVEQLNKAAYDDVLAPIGEKHAGPVGREGLRAVEQKISAVYNKVLPKAVFQADDQFAAEVSNLMDMAGSLPPQQAKTFENILRQKLFSRLDRSGVVDGKTFKGVESELRRIASGYRSDPSFDNRQLGDAIEEVLKSFRSTLERSNPDLAPQLQAANQAWARFTRIRDAAGRVGSAEGVMTPAQLQAAVRAGDRSVSKGAFARGDALMQDLSEAGKSVLGSNYPDSGTAGRLMTGLLGGAGLGYVSPTAAIATGAAMLPYTPAGQRIMAALLAQRPTQFTAPLAAGVRKAVPAAGLLGPGLARD